MQFIGIVAVNALLPYPFQPSSLGGYQLGKMAAAEALKAYADCRLS